MSPLVVLEAPHAGGETFNQLIALLAVEQKVYIYDCGVIYISLIISNYLHTRSLDVQKAMGNLYRFYTFEARHLVAHLELPRDARTAVVILDGLHPFQKTSNETLLDDGLRALAQLRATRPVYVSIRPGDPPAMRSRLIGLADTFIEQTTGMPIPPQQLLKAHHDRTP